MKQPIAPLFAALSLLPAAAPAAEPEPPVPVDGSTRITLLAEHPRVVTPTGIDVASGGRVFVLENNTHHRPEKYAHPERTSDRILVFTDPGDGRPAGEPTVFYEGLVWGTDLAISSTGWIYASTRKEIFRMRDTDGDGRADDVRGVIDMDTTGEYPHNGLSGLCFDAAGNLHFGLGENLGHPYTIRGSDGVHLSGEAEGGSIYRCRHDGKNLVRLATGVWNPFGMDFDDAGNLFATDNDPSSCPPNRLLHVVPGADFGYEFRYGRSGLHPLVTWTGEFPGTTGMVTGIGEAACGVLAFGPKRLVVASWADHRLDTCDLAPSGASFSAKRSLFARGGNDFRPVDIAMAPDRQTFYITDWVSSSYPVHGEGRVWRMRLAEPLPPPAGKPHPELARADSIRSMTEAGHVPGLVQLLDDDDPHIRNAAIHALAAMGDALEENLPATLLETPRQRAGALVALERTGNPAAAAARIPAALDDADPDVRFVAVKWIADEKLEAHRPLLNALLRDPRLDTRLFLAVMAARDRLDGKKPSDIPAAPALIRFATDVTAPPQLRATALALVPPGEKKLTLGILRKLLAEDSATLRLEAVRSLAAHPAPARGPLLAAIAGDNNAPELHRAEAVAGLALLAHDYPGLLEDIAATHSGILRAEAQRSLVGIADPARTAVSGASAAASRIVEPKPALTDLDGWEKLLGDEPGNPATGRRLFFHSKVATCSRCHRMEGRGVRVGPDLTTIWNRTGGNGDRAALRRWLLEHILNPNATVAPQFLPWEIVMEDGTVHIGLPLRKGGSRESYLGVDGREFALPKPQIASHRELTASLMPAGLLEQLTNAEVRDLLAYLMAPK